jgi:hypothetical protein
MRELASDKRRRPAARRSVSSSGPTNYVEEPSNAGHRGIRGCERVHINANESENINANESEKSEPTKDNQQQGEQGDKRQQFERDDQQTVAPKRYSGR